MRESEEVDHSRPRAPSTRSQERHQNVLADPISEYWKRNMFFPFVNHLTMKLSDILHQVDARLITFTICLVLGYIKHRSPY